MRRDTAEVVRNLQQSSHHVAMATGDSALTAVFVGTEVGITHGDKTKELLLGKDEDGAGLHWTVPRGRDKHAPRPFVASQVDSSSSSSSPSSSPSSVSSSSSSSCNTHE